MSPANAATAITWGLRRLRIDECWQAGWTGAGVRVGHLDTGVDDRHPALAGRIAAFTAFDEQGVMQPNAAARDSGLHGTHTAGIICGGTIAGQAIGVAPNARLCSGMVIEGGHVLARVLCGLDWLFDCNVRVVCLSLGVPGYHPVFEIILERLRRRGVLVVCPIGNSGSGVSCSPANYPGVLAVGAVDAADHIPRFSGDGQFHRAAGATKPDLVAPGVAIPSAEPGGRIGVRNGTSMAAAYVAGAAALLFHSCRNATADTIAAALLATAEPLPDVPTRRQGRGCVNPVGALRRLVEHGARS
jgi:subtilisin